MPGKSGGSSARHHRQFQVGCCSTNPHLFRPLQARCFLPPRFRAIQDMCGDLRKLRIRSAEAPEFQRESSVLIVAREIPSRLARHFLPSGSTRLSRCHPVSAHHRTGAAIFSETKARRPMARIEDIKAALASAHHDIGHAFAHVAQDRPIAALLDIESAIASLVSAKEKLDEEVSHG